MPTLALDLDDNDDIGFVHEVRPIIEGVLRVVEPPELYIVRVDSWFGDKWLGFSNKLVGRSAFSTAQHCACPHSSRLA